MVLIIALVSLLVMQASLTHSVTSYSYDELYYCITHGQYITAAAASLELYRESKGHVITWTVDRLLSTNHRHLFDYAYHLKQQGEDGRRIINHFFAPAFEWIIYGTPVLLTSTRDEMALKLEWNENQGYRGAFGDNSIDREHARMGWVFKPVKIENKVYFKIFNTYQQQYLKVVGPRDGDGDYKVYGGVERNNWNKYWYLRPVVNNGQTSLGIYSAKYKQPLKLGRHVDGDGDRRAWTHNGNQVDPWRVSLF